VLCLSVHFFPRAIVSGFLPPGHGGSSRLKTHEMASSMKGSREYIE